MDARMLYDLENDPEENHNISEHPQKQRNCKKHLASNFMII